MRRLVFVTLLLSSALMVSGIAGASPGEASVQATPSVAFHGAGRLVAGFTLDGIDHLWLRNLTPLGGSVDPVCVRACVRTRGCWNKKGKKKKRCFKRCDKECRTK